MTSDKDIKKSEEKELREKKAETSDHCCYVVDTCGCYVDPVGAPSIPVVVDINPLRLKGWAFLLNPFCL